jgi:hypothetical protein
LDVSGVASDDVWAVGSAGGLSLAEHWDGQAWSVVPVPAGVSLASVVAIASDDVWAVGGAGPVIVHWDGTAWSVVPGPPVAGSFADVSALGPSDVWAAGSMVDENGHLVPLMEHWDGSSWNVLPAPSKGPLYTAANGIAPAGPDDVWAVGQYYDGGVESARSIGEHWDGTAFTLVRTPNGRPVVPGQIAGLYDVVAISADDVWAVGEHLDLSTGHPLTDHWDGRHWRVGSTPRVGTDDALVAVDASPEGEVWAVGETWLYGGDADGLAYHLSDEGWTIEAVPDAGFIDSLNGVAAIGPQDVWAVGSVQDSSTRTLIEHCGP